MKPRLSKSAIQLREQIDDAFPDRDRTSDGWIGDTRHAARKSDHNPDVQGWVRAIDVDRDLAGKKGSPISCLTWSIRFESLQSLAIKGSVTSSSMAASPHLKRLGLGVLMMGSISIIITRTSALLSRAMKTVLGSISR